MDNYIDELNHHIRNGILNIRALLLRLDVDNLSKINKELILKDIEIQCLRIEKALNEFNKQYKLKNL